MKSPTNEVAGLEITAQLGSELRNLKASVH
jgi:hypothetical protein